MPKAPIYMLLWLIHQTPKRSVTPHASGVDRDVRSRNEHGFEIQWWLVVATGLDKNGDWEETKQR
jgi:hypothetical protein